MGYACKLNNSNDIKIELLTVITFTSQASQIKYYTLNKRYSYIAGEVLAGGGYGNTPIGIMRFSGDYIAAGGVALLKISYSNLDKDSTISIDGHYITKANIYGLFNIKIE